MEVISKDNAEHYLWGEGCDGWHLAKTANLSVIQELVPPGCEEVAHFHNKAEQFFYVLSGIATMQVDGEAHLLHPSQGLHIAAGTPHQLRNLHDENLSFMVISTPPSHGDRVALETCI